MTLALLYERVSTDQQDTRRQTDILTRYCAQHGIDPIQTFGDPDTSGSIPFREREEGALLFQEIARLRQAHGPDQPIAVITSEQDRIGRDTLDIIGTIRALWQMGVTPHFAAENGALVRNPHNEFILAVKASTSQLERDMIRHRIRTEMSAKRARGELCGTVPFGWDAIETGETSPKGVRIRKLIDNPAEQAWILKMSELRAAGHSYAAIARHLNTHAVPTKGGNRAPHASRLTPPQWQQGNVARVLTNATVTAWLATRHATAA